MQNKAMDYEKIIIDKEYIIQSEREKSSRNEYDLRDKVHNLETKFVNKEKEESLKTDLMNQIVGY